MKEINGLKKRLYESSQISEVFDKSKKLSKEIDELKKKSEEHHKSLQEKAKESQEKHEGIINNSKKVDELKVKEEDAFKKFIELKKEFNSISDKLKAKLMELGEHKGDFDKERENVDRTRLQNQARKKRYRDTILDEKKAAVEEKIAKGEKLTTEDILAMQGMD